MQGGAGQQQPAFKITTAAVSAANPKLDTGREIPSGLLVQTKDHPGKHSKRRERSNLNAVKMKTISGPIKSNIPLPASAVQTKIIPFLKKGPPKPSPDGIQPQAS